MLAASSSGDIGDQRKVENAGIPDGNGIYTGVFPCPRSNLYPYCYLNASGTYIIFERGNFWWIYTWPDDDSLYRSEEGFVADLEPWEFPWIVAVNGVALSTLKDNHGKMRENGQERRGGREDGAPSRSLGGS